MTHPGLCFELDCRMPHDPTSTLARSHLRDGSPLGWAYDIHADLAWLGRPGAILDRSSLYVLCSTLQCYAPHYSVMLHITPLWSATNRDLTIPSTILIKPSIKNYAIKVIKGKYIIATFNINYVIPSFGVSTYEKTQQVGMCHKCILTYIESSSIKNIQ